MATMRFLSAVVLALASTAFATSKIEFILEAGGDNHADLYEAGQWPPFTPGLTDGSVAVPSGADLTWAVRVLVHGAYNEVIPGDNLHVDPWGPGHGKYALGVANVVFDLVLIDSRADGGPNLDYFWHPSAADWPPESTAPPGYLVGFGAGYRDFDFGVGYTPGVGMAGPLGPPDIGCGVGLVLFDGEGHPLPPPLFEGQINTTGLPLGVYALEVLAEPVGNNILHGDINCAEQTFGAGSFATRVNEVIVSSTTFSIGPPQGSTDVVDRMIFYNQSYYDGRNAAIDPGAVPGNNNDDDDAIDPSKRALLPGDGLANVLNYTPYDKGINGVMFDIANAAAPITASDFTFVNQGHWGTGSTPLAPSGFLVRPGQGIGGSDRVVVTFANGSMLNGWLECTIGTGFGLPAPDVCYWGNAKADGQSVQGINILIDGTDIADARDNGHSILNRVLVDDAYDYNKDSLVNGADIILARDRWMWDPVVRLITR